MSRSSFELELMRVLCFITRNVWSSERGHVGDAWAHGGEEGRGKLRKALGSGTHALIQGWPNGETRAGAIPLIRSRPEANHGN